MRTWVVVAAVVAVVAGVPRDAAAQLDPAWRARVIVEAHSGRVNDSGVRVPPDPGSWHASQLLVASADGSWERGRLRLAGGMLASRSSDSGLTVRAREAYVRVSAAPWLDVEAGKRLVRWGVGYGFSPTGVLDPPRVANDPGDRLGIREGMPLIRADLFRNDTSLTIAVAAPARGRERLALRVRTVWRGGLEAALIGSAASGTRASVGANVTHVIGQRLEWHAEALVHGDRPSPAGHRPISGVAGLQYTLPGLNVVLEYHRVASGGGSSHQLFLRAARAGADVKIAPELIVIRAIGDGGWTTVAGLGWNVQRRLEVHARATQARGGRGAAAGLVPASSTLLAGATIRF